MSTNWLYRNSSLVEMENDGEGAMVFYRILFLFYILIVVVETFQCGMLQRCEMIKYSMLKKKLCCYRCCGM
jgi:hypothetical protein